MIVKLYGRSWDAGTANVVLVLKKGATVFVRKDNRPGETMFDRQWSMFSGYLIA